MARSADVITTASAPSVSRQLSNRHSGSEIQRASMYSSRVSGLWPIVAAGLRFACLRNASATLARWSRVAAVLVHVPAGEHRDLVDRAEHARTAGSTAGGRRAAPATCAHGRLAFVGALACPPRDRDLALAGRDRHRRVPDRRRSPAPPP